MENTTTQNENLPTYDGIVIMRHYKYTNYGANENGEVFNIKNEPKKIKCVALNNGYYAISIRYNNKNKFTLLSRFVYECFSGQQINDENNRFVIDHIDNDKSNNNINNLQICTQQQNITKKFAGGYVNSTRRNRIRCIDTTNNDITEYKSYYAASLNLLICIASIYRCAHMLQKTAISKIDKKHYKFEIIT